MKTMDDVKCNNDPWTPLPKYSGSREQSNAFDLSLGLEDPLHQMLDSDRYIKSLESKLKKLTKVKNIDPSSKDMISSLALFHEDQMKRYVDDLVIEYSNASSITSSEESMNPLTYMQRKLHPEKQPLSAEELLELLKEDVLAKIFEDSFDCSGSTSRISDNKMPSPTLLPSSIPQTSCDLSQASSLVVAQQVDPQKDSSVKNSEENWANFDDMDSQLSNNGADVS